MSTILVIEDSEGQRAEVRAALEACQLFDRVLEANNGIHGLKLLLSEEVDLVLCDLEMPGLDGEKILRMRSAAGDAENPIPFLVLTAVTDPERRARLLRDGASDAITKPFHTSDLIARIDLHLRLVEAQRELVAKNHELERLTTTDPLTGISNRRQLDESLSAEFARTRRSRRPFAVAMGDIDHFKTINDEHGHLVGDRVLTRVAEAMAGVVRETDCGGRFGGEEFLAVLGNNDIEGALIFAERWRQAVEDTKIEVDDGEPISVTISIGVSAWNESLKDSASMVDAADRALYEAKDSGRNCIRSRPARLS